MSLRVLMMIRVGMIKNIYEVCGYYDASLT